MSSWPGIAVEDGVASLAYCPGHPRLRKKKDQHSLWNEPRGSSPRAALAPLAGLASFPSLAGLVVFAEGLYPIPSRTRPLNSPAPMVLSLKTWKSRSLPGLPRTEKPLHDPATNKPPRPCAAAFVVGLLNYQLPIRPTRVRWLAVDEHRRNFS